MKKINVYLLLLIVIISGFFTFSCIQQKGNDSGRPNLVFVFPDQMRGQAMGFMGEEPVITPRLDKFA